MNSISGKNILYVWKGNWPWDIRIDKICTSLGEAGANVRILAKQNPGEAEFQSYEFNSVARDIIHRNNYLSLPVPYNIFWKKAIQRQALEFQPDIIIVREILIASQAAEVANIMHIPVIMDMAENYPALMKLWKKYRSGVINRLLYHYLDVAKRAERKCIPLMNGIMVVCDEQIERLHSEYGYDEKNMAVIHNTPLLSFGSEVKEFKTRKDDRITFSHHGHLTDEKKIDTFLLAFLRVENHHNRFKFVIAGDGESLPELRQIHANAGSPDNVVFLGAYNYSDLPEIINSCDYGVLPYTPNDFNNNTVHNKVFDYFAFKKPVITSIAKPIERIIAETGAGVSLDFASEENCAELFDGIGNYNYNEMSDKAYNAFRSKYNWEQDASVMIEFIGNYIKK